MWGDETLTGRLLVAAPALSDPNFSRTVVLVLEHQGALGALGVVLNRPSTLSLGKGLARWAELAADPAVLFVGGPVHSDHAIALARLAPGATGALSEPGPGVAPGQGAQAGSHPAWRPLFGRVAALDLGADPGLAQSDLECVRIFAGYAGWMPEQLEREIAVGGWIVVDAQANDAFGADPDRLWRSVLRRQGGDLAVLSALPAEPLWN